MKIQDRILPIVDLMMGALYADATITGEEGRAIRVILGRLLLCSPDALPPHVTERIETFSLRSFDIERTVAEFLSDPPMKKRRLLELIASLCDADGTDIAEDEYLRDLAKCLGMEPEEYRGVVLDYEIEGLRRSFTELRDSTPAVGIPRWRGGIGSASKPPVKEPPRAVPRSTPPPIPEAARRPKG